MEVHLLTRRGEEQGAEGPNVAWLGTLVAYLDRFTDLAIAADELVLPHGLHAGGGLGALGGV